MSDQPPKVNAFFDSYRFAFERLDAPAIVEHFAFPCHVTSDVGKVVLAVAMSQAEWAGQIDQLLGSYRAIKVASARVLDLAATELTPRLFQAVVHWELHDGAGRVLYDFRAMYTLAEVDGALRIVAIAHNEGPRLRERLVRPSAHSN